MQSNLNSLTDLLTGLTVYLSEPFANINMSDLSDSLTDHRAPLTGNEFTSLH